MVVIGYDDKHFYFQNPSLERGYRGRIKTNEFMRRWKDSTAEGVIHRRCGLALWKDDDSPTYPTKVSKAKNV